MTRILVVEDEAAQAGVVEVLLRNLGYDVVGIADSGVDAIRLAGATNPDLVLMDIRLHGDLDGIATAERLRADFDTPIVYVTAYADHATLERAKVSGPLGYVVKPFEEEDLSAAIEVALFRRQLERELRAAETRFRELFERSLAGIFVTTIDGTLLECNTAFATILGYATREEILGQSLADVLVESAEWPRLIGGLRVVGTATNLEMRFRRRDGVVVWTLANASRVGEGAAGRIEGQILDVTEHRRAEHVNRAREALQAVVALARATAHEIFNPLTALVGRLDLLTQQVDDEKIRRQAELALQSADAIRDIVLRMINITQLAFARVPSDVPSMIDIRKSSEGDPGETKPPKT
jgi:two-component system, cell cycle sensor histidine kinase and response regulator CckA